MTAAQGRFLDGPTMGHVVRMTLTGATGITFVFLVDAANLFWISRLGEPVLMAAIGFAFAIQFFSVSSGVGLMIAATALVSRSIGTGERAAAREQASAAAILAVATQAGVAALVVGFRHDLVALAGAEGEAARLAARYLALSVPSLAFMAAGMVATAALRAEGDGARAMYVTLISGSVALVIDPVLIYRMGLGLEGAAASVVITRAVLCGMGLLFAIRSHELMARPRLHALRETWRPYFAIALPAIATQMSTPFGNYVITAVIAGFGDSAVAAWAVISRLTVVAFGGLFSLAGAIGGIFGQNYGAGLYPRLRSAYRDALIFAAGYALVAWAVLAAASDPVARGFGLDAEGARVLRAFTHLGAGAFAVSGALFVANAAFNSLGRPGRATLVNWLRDGVLTYPAAAGLGAVLGAAGVIYAQALVGVLAGAAAGFWGWMFLRGLDAAPRPALDPAIRRAYRDPNRYRRR